MVFSGCTGVCSVAANLGRDVKEDGKAVSGADVSVGIFSAAVAAAAIGGDCSIVSTSAAVSIVVSVGFAGAGGCTANGRADMSTFGMVAVALTGPCAQAPASNPKSTNTAA